MTKDFLSEVFKEAYNNVVSEWQAQGLSEEDIINRLSQDKINSSLKALLDKATEDHHKFFVDKMFEISHRQKIESDKFIAHQNEIWGECFVVSETMYVMAVEAAEQYSAFVSENIKDDIKAEKQYTFMALQYMQGRCCQEFLEILYLMKLGFADCAYARWRSMYELCCNASFIIKHGETIAKQYVEQSQTNNHKYTWTKGAKKDDGTDLRITTFREIQDNCDVNEAWKKQYKLACYVNHGSPQGTFKRLCLLNEQSLVVIGQSDYRITTPAEHSAISLQWITSMFLNIFPCADALVYARVIHDWVEEVRKIYFSTADKCFGTDWNYNKETDNDSH
ncbi:MAG: hypothetical protein K2J79_11295 [Ruminiclostridium sp.]|nr:hypothetical protein [Ruminiclostridium sp.]